MERAGRESQSTELGSACSIKGCIELQFAQDEATGVGYCIDHLEEMIERWEAVAIAPSLGYTLPPIEHRHIIPTNY